MDENNIVCPVCTLYLRPGITLKSHLGSHPKQKVIDALVRLALFSKTESRQPQCDSSPSNSHVNASIVNQSWNQSATASNTSHVAPVQGNHLFIYQQSMSTTSPPQPNVLNANPLSQQYIIPTVFNPQMMPYVYQQQQVIMSSNSCMQQPPQLPQPPQSLRPRLFELPPQPIHEPDEEETVCHENAGRVETEPRQDMVEEQNKHEYNGSSTIHNIKEIEIEDVIKRDPNNMEYREESVINHRLVKNIEIQNHSQSEHYEEYDDAIDHSECLGSPHSVAGSDWSIRVRSDLNKACQTQNNAVSSPHSTIADNEIENDIPDLDEPDYYYVGQDEEEPATCTTAEESTNNYEQTEPIYSSSNILQPADNIDFVDIDGMRVIINGFASNQIIAQVENFETSKQDRNGVLMTIGEVVETHKEDYNDQRDVDESMSIESSNVNIRTDERMPPRGELSGQESLGDTSDVTWNRLQYQEGSSHMSTSYDLLARESWEPSDSSDVEGPSSHSTIPPRTDCPKTECDNDTPTIISYTAPPLNFRCSTCGDGFKCLKERKEHEHEKHPEKFKKINEVGSELGKRKVKKLVIKPKQDKPDSENNFDNSFTNRLKLETTTKSEGMETTESQETVIENVKADDNIIFDIKKVCSICDSVLENARELRLHKLQVHNISVANRYKCSTCQQAFPSEFKFTEHLQVHPLECKICGRLFYRRQNMQLHMKRHLGLRPYKCEICEKTFITKQKLLEHKNIHTGESPIKCSFCDESFRRHSNLIQHRNKHHYHVKQKVKDYICMCGEIFHSKKKLAWHKEIHDSKPKACTQCNEKFIHMASLTRHMRRAHNERFLPKEERSSENAECPICKKVYLKSSLDVHIRNHTGQRPFTCLICNKDFTTKWNLKLHKWTHASRTSKPFKCDQCNGAFIRETDYVAHMNSHKSVRPYTCNYCGAQFIRKYNCQRHVKEHENGKTFNCQVCGKSFHRSYYLKDHMRVHSGIRPYSCHICGKTSTTKSNHNKHVQIHHAREPVSTEN